MHKIAPSVIIFQAVLYVQGFKTSQILVFSTNLASAQFINIMIPIQIKQTARNVPLKAVSRAQILPPAKFALVQTITIKVQGCFLTALAKQDITLIYP